MEKKEILRRKHQYLSHLLPKIRAYYNISHYVRSFCSVLSSLIRSPVAFLLIPLKFISSTYKKHLSFL